MAHKIRVACLGTSEFLSRIVEALVKNQVVPTENIFLSKTDGADVQRFAASGCNLLDDDMNTIMKGEIVLVAAPAQEVSAVLAPICGCTSGRYLVVVSDCGHVDEIAERVAKGTQIMVVSIYKDADGYALRAIEYSKGFATYMKPPCEDMVQAVVGAK